MHFCEGRFQQANMSPRLATAHCTHIYVFIAKKNRKEGKAHEKLFFVVMSESWGGGALSGVSGPILHRFLIVGCFC